MTKKHLLTLLLISFFTSFLVACSTPKDKEPQPSDSEIITPRLHQAAHQDKRANFEKIKLATVDSSFTGGTSLEELISLFGEPSQHDPKTAGEVTIDAYTWQFDQVTLTVNLYQNSSIVKTISNFTFARELGLSQKEYQQLQKGMSYEDVKKILTEPDNYSQASSSDHQTLQAIWVSGLKTDTSGANISLVFENNQLTEMSQVGLEE